MTFVHGLHCHHVQRNMGNIFVRDMMGCMVTCALHNWPDIACLSLPGLDDSWQLVPCGRHCPSTRSVNHSLTSTSFDISDNPQNFLPLNIIHLNPLKDPIFPLNSPPSSPMNGRQAPSSRALNGRQASFNVSFRPQQHLLSQ